MRTRAIATWGLLLALSACGEAVVLIPDDADDAGAGVDVGAGADASSRDAAGEAGADGEGGGDTGASPDDASVGGGDAGEDAGGPSEDPDDAFVGMACSVEGRAGTCEREDGCDAPRVRVPGFCPGSAAIRCCVEPAMDPPDGECDPDASPVPNTTRAEAPGVGGCPDGMLPLEDGSACIDQYEASLVEDAAGGARAWSPYRNPGSAPVRAVSVAGVTPQGYITGDQAEAACQRAGKRLCTSTEWQAACRGGAGRTYPYGATEQPGVCNDARAQHPVVEYFGTSADWIWSELGNACINQLPDSLALTGAHPGCVTPEGAYDMVGNLHEWVADASGTFRGGFYVDTYRNGPGCLYRTTAHSRGHWDYSTGFRCCADAP